MKEGNNKTPFPGELGKNQGLKQFLQANFGNDFQAKTVNGGRIHTTFAISSNQQQAILKIRGERWAKVPERKINPKDIADEWQALSLFSEAVPDSFAKPLACSPELGLLLMSDIIQNDGMVLSTVIEKGKDNPDLWHKTGASLGNVHKALVPLRESIKPEGDELTYQHLLEKQLKNLHHPVLDKVTEELNKQQRQLVMGDVQSTNIGITKEGEIKFLDVERAHRGNPLFEVGYLIGDLMHKSYNNPESLKQNISALLEGYKQNNPKVLDSKQHVLQKIAVGTLLYNLTTIDNSPPETKKNIINNVEALLYVENISWNNIIGLLTHEKSISVEKFSQKDHLVAHPDKESVYIPNVHPFSANQLQALLTTITENDLVRELSLENLKLRNQEILTQSATIGVVLDGRSGWLGDMVEASRLIYPLHSAGKKVVIYTPHPDLFNGQDDKAITIVPIPQHIPGRPNYPSTPEMLDFLASQKVQIPILIPTEASYPVFLELDREKKGRRKIATVKERDLLEKQVELIFKPRFDDPENPIRGSKDAWKRQSIHQLQALQTTAYILGIPDSDKWTTFPDVFLSPDLQSQSIGNDVFNKLHLKNEIPVFIHLGASKSNMMKQSKEVSGDTLMKLHQHLKDELNPELLQQLKMIYFTPQEQKGTGFIENLVEDAENQGLSVTQLVPQEQWTLGAMVTFMQKIQEANGVIIGPDSMPSGHLAPAIGLRSIVLGNKIFDPKFYCPPNLSIVILPPGEQVKTADILPTDVSFAMQESLLQLKNP